MVLKFPAALPFSKNPRMQDEVLLRRKLNELTRLRDERQKIILKDVTEGVKKAMYNTKIRGDHEHRKPHEEVQIHHWKPQSVMYITDYRKLNESDRAEAIQGDVEFFESAVKRLQAQFREWKIEPRYADKAKTIPNKILVSK